MKKVFLLVASVLAAIQSIANRNSDGTNSNPLILSPSDGKYNHGSHASHASHAAHYSSLVSVKQDSVRNVSRDDRNKIIASLAKLHNCHKKEIKINHIFISKKCEILTNKRYDDEVSISLFKASMNKNCLYIDYSICISDSEEYELVIPLDSNNENCYQIHYGYHNVHFMKYYRCSKIKKSDWMIVLEKKYK